MDIILRAGALHHMQAGGHAAPQPVGDDGVQLAVFRLCPAGALLDGFPVSRLAVTVDNDDMGEIPLGQAQADVLYNSGNRLGRRVIVPSSTLAWSARQ